MTVAGRVAGAQETVPLVGNHPASIDSAAPIGALPAQAPLSMALTLKLRDPAGAERLVAAIQNPASPSYHHWLTSAEFADRFDPTQADTDEVANWLTSQGFTVLSSDRHARLITFSGSVAQAEQVFSTTLHSFGGNSFGNIEDPAIPARFASVIAHIHGLDNMVGAAAASRFVPHLVQSARANGRGLSARGLSTPRGKVLAAAGRETMTTGGSLSDATIGGQTAFAPADFRTFYDQNPLVSGGVDGSGDCIAIVGDSDFELSSVVQFNNSFQLPASSITTVVVNHDPGFFANDEEEALLDLEWSHVLAPGAATRFYLGDSSAPVIAPIVDQINKAVNDNVCSIISVSFGLCGGSSAFYSQVVSPIYLKAALQGQSIFISSGDQGAAGLVFSGGQCMIGTSRNVNELAADPNVIAVGGVSFNPTYDGSGNDTSLVTNTTPRVWNDPNDGQAAGGAGGGGSSSVYQKPNYQAGVTPNDGKRDLPDVALIASPFFPGVFTYMDADCFNLGCDGAGSPITAVFGGTSLAAPAWAGIAKLVEQFRHARQGSMNIGIYQLAGSSGGPAVFQDVTLGNNNFNGVVGFNAGPGFDLASGWGTVDINAFVNSFNGAGPPGPKKLSISPGSLNFGNVDFAAAGPASKVRRVTISNPRAYKANAIIKLVAGSPGFTPDPACTANIPSGGRIFCNVTFKPQGIGAVAGTLTIEDNAGSGQQVVKLAGRGILGPLAVAPGSLSFSRIPVNTTSAPKTVTLDNDAGTVFTISSITTGNVGFSASQNCLGALASDCHISVTYTAKTTARVTDSLTITDVPDHFSKVVHLVGTGK